MSLKIGLLVLYLELYDERCPEIRPEIDRFAEEVAKQFRDRAVNVVTAPLCRTAAEARQALERFKEAGVDLIATLHAAYSPSLESADVLAACGLPLVMLDTTPDATFDTAALGSGRLMFNHGIHGVQDLANVLRRRGKRFEIVAGCGADPAFYDRAIQLFRGIRGGRNFRHQRIGLIGQPFAGMGDFSVPYPVLQQRFGIEIVTGDADALADGLEKADAPDVLNELGEIRRRYPAGSATDAELADAIRSGRALRRFLDREKLNGFSMNFMAFNGGDKLPVVPFLEASFAQTRGIGYAGEGDVLTAALVGAVLSVLPESTFSEMFCPDWQGNRVYLSHMGEVNPELLAEPRLDPKPFPFTPAGDPVIAAGLLAPGNAMLVNILPEAGDQFTLLAHPVELLGGETALPHEIGGWLRPGKDLRTFLEDYSRAGGTHHLLISRGGSVELFQAMAAELGIGFKAI